MIKGKFRSAYEQSLTPELELKARKELGETPEIRERCLTELKQLIAKEENLHCLMDDKFLLRFLRYRKFNISRAFESLCDYYRFQFDYRETFFKYTIPGMKGLVESKYLNMFSYTNEKGEAIICVKPVEIDLDKFTMREALGLPFMCLDGLANYEPLQICGILIILDLERSSYRLVKEFFPYIFAYVKAFRGSYPIRLKGYHVINLAPYFRSVARIAKSFMTEKLKKRFFVHSDLKSLHEHISPQLLPSELGGFLGPFNNEKIISEINSHQEMINMLKEYGYKKNSK